MFLGMEWNHQHLSLPPSIPYLTFTLYPPHTVLDILHIAIVNYCFSFSLSCQPRPNFYSLAQVAHISVLYPWAESELLVTRTHIKPAPGLSPNFTHNHINSTPGVSPNFQSLALTSNLPLGWEKYELFVTDKQRPCRV